MNGGSDLRKPSGWLTSLGIILRAYLGATRNFWEWRLDLWRHPDHLMEQTKTRTLLFIRHGQSTFNVEHRLPGQLSGIDLTAEGRTQATRLGEALKDLAITTVVSSPLERARDTAAAVAGPHGLELVFEPDLMDTDVGLWTGQN
jgi:probable phosphoglycerate mutase